MPAAGSAIEIQYRDDLAVVTFRDRILLDNNDVKEIEHALSKLANDRSVRKMVVDFSTVQALSSRMLSALVNVHNELGRKDGVLGLCNLGKNLQKIIEVTNLGALLTIFPDQQKAIETMG